MREVAAEPADQRAREWSDLDVEHGRSAGLERPPQRWPDLLGRVDALAITAERFGEPGVIDRGKLGEGSVVGAKARGLLRLDHHPAAVVGDDDDDRRTATGRRLELHRAEPEAAVADRYENVLVRSGQLGGDPIGKLGPQAPGPTRARIVTRSTWRQQELRPEVRVALARHHGRSFAEDRGDLAPESQRMNRCAVGAAKG